MQTSGPHDDEIICSVILPVYNHESFIRICLDSCLAQVTTFRYELLVGEDDSDDASREICKEYARRFPDKIRLFLNSREKVIYINGRPTGRWNLLNLIEHAQGKYMAICNGDDYWIDELKLQKQVDFLETNPDYAMCHCRSLTLQDIQGEPVLQEFPHKGASTSTIHDLLRRNDIVTSSVMYRKNLVDTLPSWIATVPPMLDWPMHLAYAFHGRIRRLDERPMAVYRIHRGGIWSGQKQYIKSLEALAFCEFLKRKWLKYDLHPYIDDNIYSLHYRIAYSSRDHDRDLFWKHFKCCLLRAGKSSKDYRRIFILLLIFLKLLKFDGQDIKVARLRI